jgi:hypothetical protein
VRECLGNSQSEENPKKCVSLPCNSEFLTFLVQPREIPAGTKDGTLGKHLKLFLHILKSIGIWVNFLSIIHRKRESYDNGDVSDVSASAAKVRNLISSLGIGTNCKIE